MSILRIHSECGKIQTRITPNTDTTENTGKYGPEIAPYLDSFYAVRAIRT